MVKCYIYQVVPVLLVYSSIVQSVVRKIIKRKVAGSNLDINALVGVQEFT